MQRGKIDVIIPAYRAHKTIIRALGSIAIQTIAKDVTVTIVNDQCPEGDYQDAVKVFCSSLDVKEITLDKNSGPGVARQAGIDTGDGEYITFLDADDTFLTATALETLRDGIEESKTYQVASASFISAKNKARNARTKEYMMVYLFGKLYRRAFLDKYKIRFLDSRANEDSGFNRIILMLCDNKDEDIKYIPEEVYLYRDDNETSITRINGELYYYDQCCCGVTDNFIYALEHVKKYKPFSGRALQETVSFMMHLYADYIAVLGKMPIFAPQLWEYVKKYYHKCYKPIEPYVSSDVMKEMYSQNIYSDIKAGFLRSVVPQMSLTDFFTRLHTEEYDPNLIDEIRQEMREDPMMQEILLNNIKSGGVSCEL